MKQTRCLYIIMCMLVAAFFTACHDVHEDEFEIPTGSGALIVELRSENASITVRDIHLFIFDGNERLAIHHYFTDPKELASEYFDFPADRYTIIAVMNVGADFMPPTRADLPDITLPDFHQWLNTVAPDYPDMLTGMVQIELGENEVKRAVIILRDGTGGITLSTLRLHLELPSPNLPDYPGTRSARADAGYSLRSVVEVYRKVTADLIHRRTALPTPTATAGQYSLELSLDKGDYDFRIWTDYVPYGTTADYHYSTDDLKFVIFNPERSYTACTDSRDVSYATPTISLTEDTQEETVAMQRPLAKYRIIATDLAKYLALVTAGTCPPLDELTVSVHYEYFFPCSFNVTTGRPNDSTTGISYATTLPASTAESDRVQIGCDWIWASSDETFARITVRITDLAGNIVSQTSGIRINYRLGHLTTISGQFLTAGKGSGGIYIDTTWEDDFIYEF